MQPTTTTTTTKDKQKHYYIDVRMIFFSFTHSLLTIRLVSFICYFGKCIDNEFYLDVTVYVYVIIYNVRSMCVLCVVLDMRPLNSWYMCSKRCNSICTCCQFLHTFGRIFLNSIIAFMPMGHGHICLKAHLPSVMRSAVANRHSWMFTTNCRAPEH